MHQAKNLRILTKSCILPALITAMRNNLTKLFALILLCLCSNMAFSQSVSINSNGAVADTSAMLDVKSTTKGLLIPRMTATQKNAIFQPATGLLVYQTDGETGFYYFNGTAWYLLITTAINTDKQNTLIYTTRGF